MPRKFVDDIDIRYEAYGRGETVVYLQSVLGGINPGAYYFAGRLSRNHRVIIWDGPNCGQSGAAFKDVSSEYHQACGYLAGLLDALDEGPVHVAGCSGGGEMGLLFAHLYPGRVKSLAMYRPTDASCEVEQAVVKARYFDIAAQADESMERAVAYAQAPPPERFGGLSRWLADLYRGDSGKFDGMDHKAFAKIMRRWGKWMGDPLFYRANLRDDDLEKITVPALICSCADDYHPERLAEDLHRHLPDSVFVPSKRYRAEGDIYDGAGDEHPFGGFTDFVDEYDRFLS